MSSKALKAVLEARGLYPIISVKESTIANWEQGRNALGWFERVAKLCEVLKCSPNELFGYVEVGGDTEVNN